MNEYPPSHSETTLTLNPHTRTILESISDGFVLLDTAWRIIYMNPQAESILDRTREELLGKNLWDAFPEAVDTPFWTKSHEAADTQAIVEFEDFYPSMLKWFHVRVYPSEAGLAINFQDMTERKQAQELRLQLAAIVESSGDAIIGKTREGIITSWNRAAERIYGYSAEEVVGRPITLIFPPDRQEEFARIMEQILRGERIDHYETTRLRKDGTILPVSVTISPIHDSDGHVIGASAIAHDISERKRAEEQEHFLAEVSKVLTATLDYQETLANIARLVVPQLADWFAVDLVDAEGHFELIEIAHKDPEQGQWARALREKYPVDPNALTGAPHVVRTGQSELYPKITDEMLVAAARNEEELTIARQIGYTSVIIIPLVARGKTLGVVTFVTAESGRRYNERDLALVEEVGRRAGVALDNARLYREVAQARDQLDIILQGVTDGIIVYDTHSQIIYANEAAAQMTGYTSIQDMLQTPPPGIVARYEIVDEQGLPFPHSRLTHIRVFAGEREAQAIIGYANRTSGQPKHWLLAKSRPVLGENGNMAMVITIIHDVTERMQIERRKDEFISMTSHELKTPVTSLKGFTNVLQRRLTKQGDEQGLHYLARIDAQLNKLTKLISDLLDISRMQTGKLAFQVEAFDLDRLVHETVENVQAATTTHQILIEGRTDARVLGDKDRIEQVFINLLTNAVKYSPRANKVLVRLSRDQACCIVRIQDFGIGIDETHQQKIFERFYQVTDPEEKTYPGLGIGLYISSEIVERHQGRIEVQSRKGEGATFTVILPLLQEGK